MLFLPIGLKFDCVLAESGQALIPSLPAIPSPWAAVADSTLQALLFLLPGLLTVAIVQALTIKQKQAPFERVIQALLYTFINHVTWQVMLLVANFLLLIVTFGHHWIMHDWWQPGAKTQLIGLGFCALAWGIVITWIVNIGWLHSKLRNFQWTKPCFGWLQNQVGKIDRLKPSVDRLSKSKLIQSFKDALCFGITKRSSRPNEWYDVFYDSDDKYVVVHLKDQRRIYGWAHLYPDLPTEGHLFIREAEWLIDPPTPSTSTDSTAPIDSSAVAPTVAPTAQSSTPTILMNILIDVTDVKFIEFVMFQIEEQTNGTASKPDNQEGRRESEASRPATTAPTSAAST